MAPTAKARKTRTRREPEQGQLLSAFGKRKKEPPATRKKTGSAAPSRDAKDARPKKPRKSTPQPQAATRSPHQDPRHEPPEQARRPTPVERVHINRLDVRTSGAGTKVWAHAGAAGTLRGEVVNAEVDEAWARMTRDWTPAPAPCYTAVTIAWSNDRRSRLAWCPDCCGSGTYPVPDPVRRFNTRLSTCLHCGGRGWKSCGGNTKTDG